MSNERKSADQLEDALRLLDYELTALKLDEPLRVRAIGGYALIKHGVRKGDRASTLDIDTVTKDYGAAVERAIRRVATQLELEPGWLNNDNVLDNDTEHIEEMFQAEWLPQPLGLRNISVAIASVPTLTRAKISSTQDSIYSDRPQDAADLRDLLEHQGITTMKQFQDKYPDPFDDYPAAQEVARAYLAGEESPDLKSRFPELADVELDEFDWSDIDNEPAESYFRY